MRNIASAEDHALSILLGAVNIPSVTGEEEKYAGYAADALEATGATVEMHPVAPDRSLVVGTTKGRGDAEPIIYASHLDTVGAGRWEQQWAHTPRENPFAAQIIDGAVWGRGAADAKGPTAAHLGALHEFAATDTRPAGDVITILVPDEEAGEPDLGYSEGMKRAIALMSDGTIPTGAYAIYGEPTGGELSPTCLGFVMAEITVRNADNDGSSWTSSDRQTDALRAGVALYNEIAAIADRIDREAEHADYARSSLQVIGLSSGQLVAPPDHCTLKLIRSYRPDEVPYDVVGEIGEAIGRVSLNTSCRFAVRYLSPRDHPLGGTGMDTPHGPWIDSMCKAAGLTIGKAPWWSDGKLLAANGFPTVFYGCGDYRYAHSSWEHLPVTELARNTNALHRILASGVASGG